MKTREDLMFAFVTGRKIDEIGKKKKLEGQNIFKRF